VGIPCPAGSVDVLSLGSFLLSPRDVLVGARAELLVQHLSWVSVDVWVNLRRRGSLGDVRVPSDLTRKYAVLCKRSFEAVFCLRHLEIKKKKVSVNVKSHRL